MFRKIRDQVDAASAALGIGDEKIRSLTQMGFDRERARHALDATDGNVDRAADLLLASGGLRPHQQRGGRLQRQAASASGTAALAACLKSLRGLRRPTGLCAFVRRPSRRP